MKGYFLTTPYKFFTSIKMLAYKRFRIKFKFLAHQLI